MDFLQITTMTADTTCFRYIKENQQWLDDYYGSRDKLYCGVGVRLVVSGQTRTHFSRVT